MPGSAAAETYSYDAAGRLTQATYSSGSTVGFVYDSRGNLVTRLASTAGTDTDGDGLSDAVETGTGILVDADDTGTNPASADTDGDGFDDGAEVALGTNPNDASDFPTASVPALDPVGLGLLALLLAAGIGFGTRTKRSRRTAALLVPAMLLAGAGDVRGHGCDPTPMQIGVGDDKVYQITADVNESEESGYNLAFNDNPAAVSVLPDSSVFFQSFQAGRFHITGLAPGTANLMLMWNYDPHFASGVCNLVVNVVAASEAPPPTAANNEDSGKGGDPVSTHTGELVQDPVVDLDLGGPLPVRFLRYHASGIARDSKIRGGLGNGWLHNYDMRMLQVGPSVEIVFLWGRSLEFAPAGGGGSGWVLQKPLDVAFQLVDDGTDRVLFDPRSQARFRFDNQGRLTVIADRNGNALSLTYDHTNLASVSDGLGRQLTFSYTSNQTIATVSDGTRTLNYTVDGTFDSSAGNLTQATDARGKTTTYTYTPPYPAGDPFAPMNRGPDPSYQLSQVLPEGNSPYTQTWDSDGRVATQTNARGGTTTFTWGSGTTTLTDPLGNSVVDSHDSDGDITSQVDASGQTSSLSYDAAGHRSSLTDREGNATAYTFDASSGGLASVTRADGSTTAMSYSESSDALGFTLDDLSRVDYADGAFETFTRDANGNLTTHTTRGGETTSLAYNSAGQISSVTNPLGGTTNFSYNADGTRASLTTPAGDTTSFGYDALRRPISTTLPDSNTTSRSYDDGNLVTGVTDSNGNTATTSYDDNGRPTSVVDRLGNTTTLAWDAMNQIASVTDPLGNASTLAYDNLDRVESTTNALGETTSFGRDALGRVTAVTDPVGEIWTRTYDAEGLLTGKADPLGNTTVFARDALGRVTRVTSPLGFETDFSYDSMGRLTALSDGLGRATSFDHDENGRIEAIQLPGGVASSDYTRNGLGQVTQLSDPGDNNWSFAYDAQGRATSATDPLGLETAVAYDSRSRPSGVTFPDFLGTLAYSYDANGNPTQALYSDTTTLDFVHDARDRLISAEGVSRGYDAAGRMTESNGLTIGYDAANRITSILYAPSKSVAFAYDARGLLTSVTDWVGAAVTFGYDDAGRLTSMTRANGVGTSFSRDSDGRLTAVDHGGLAGVDLAYDAAGQVTGATRSGPQANAAPAPALATRSFDAASRDEATSHDALGRLTQDGTTTYTWDLASRLVEIDANGNAVTFGYDDLGRRNSRTEGGTTRSFTWNDALGIASIGIESEGGVAVRYHVHAPGGALLYSLDASDDSRHFLHFDETGNTVLVTDDAGSTVASYAYSPYGQVTAESGGLDQPFTWQGQLGVMQEGGDGLYYSRARYYDAPRARFLSHDPLTGLGPRGSNPYQYAYANPLSFSDPTGLLPEGPSWEPMRTVANGLGLAAMSGGTFFDIRECQLMVERAPIMKKSVAEIARIVAATDEKAKNAHRLSNAVRYVRAADLASDAARMRAVGHGFSAAAAALTAAVEGMTETRSQTRTGRVANATAVGAVDLAFALNPITAAGMLISNVIDAGVGATLGEEYAPGVHQVLYNAGRTVGALADEAVTCGESGATWRLAEEMSSGHHGGITRQFAEDGEWWGDLIYDTFLKPTGDDNPYRP